MLSRIVVALLALTVLGAVAVGVYDATRPAIDEIIPAPILTDSAPQEAAATPVPTATTALIPTTPPQEAAPTQDAQPVQQAVDTVGEAWAANGIITALEDTGLTLQTTSGAQVFVELGPATYWQAQGVPLAIGQEITVDGFSNGEQIHARIVTTAIGETLVVRTEDGMPLWSGGNQNGSTQQEATNQVAPEDWLTLRGTITALTSGRMTLQTDTDGTLDMQIGQPAFWQAQGITLAVGDVVDVLGFWQDATFSAGEITTVATGESIMLRDPNGRPLWGGPGRNGNGASSQGAAESSVQKTSASAGGGGGGAQGQGGYRYRGGRAAS